MPFRYILLPLSFIYYITTFLRNFFYDRNLFKIHSLGAKVISVGNITWGGTGKTPAILYLAQRLSSQGHRVVILTRGYGKDEERLFSRMIQHIPVIVGKDRIKSGKIAVEKYSADTVLLDDGFQYRRLKRDLDILCIDAMSPFGNRCVIPAGSLRESLGGLKRADVFLITKTDIAKDIKSLEDDLKKINARATIVKSIHKPQHFYGISDGQSANIDCMKDKEVALLSGIGSPVSFEKTISSLGIKVKRHFIFRDHHWYRAKDLHRIKIYCLENKINTVITTEKDAVRLKALSSQLSAISFFALRIQLRIIDNEQEFYKRLSGVYSG